MADNRIEIHYKADDITSTQRTLILRSSQFKLLLLFWGLGVGFVVLHMLLPQIFTFIPGVTWAMTWQIGLVYVATIVLLLYIVPWISFHFTRFWRLALVYHWNTKTMRLSVAGKPGGLQLEWSQVRKVEETGRAFVIFYEESTKHFILPKSAFSESAEKRFRVQLARWAAGEKPAAKKAPAAVEEAVDKEDTAEE